jgi:hypothetical protein
MSEHSLGVKGECHNIFARTGIVLTNHWLDGKSGIIVTVAC